MKKVGLQDMKKRNSQIILDLILKHGPLSRIEIAKYSELSPSTVTSLVNQLVEKGLLTESGTLPSTGGRKRIELSINSAFGDICIIEIGRKGTVLYFYDMNLGEHTTIPVTDRFITGNDLLVSISSSIFSYYKDDELIKRKLVGIGLVFQEDVQPSDCNVIYSTSLSSASISLKDALVTQFRVPVMEEYIDAFSISELLHEGEKKSLNNAHINIGKNILACITIEGKPLKLKGGRFSDITPLLFNIGTDIPEMGVLEELSRKENISAEKDHANYPNHILTILSKQITHVISVFCTLFPLDTIFLSGNVTRSNKFIRDVREFTRLKMAPAPSPAIQVLDTFQQPVTELLAKKIRNKVLSAIGI